MSRQYCASVLTPRAVDAAAATHLVATVAVTSTVAAVAEALEDVAGAASGGGRRLLFIVGRVPVLLDHMGARTTRTKSW